MKKARQISVCLENKPGRLAHLCGSLAKGGVNIVAISVVETTEQGVVRMVVDNPAKALKLLEQCCAAACAVTDVLLVDLPNKVGALAKMADRLAKRRVNVSFVYGSTGAGGRKANIVVGAPNVAAAAKALRSKR